MTGDERTGRDGRDGREAWQDGFGDDPVERFFAAERDRVTSRAGDDLHWRSIVTQARGGVGVACTATSPVPRRLPSSSAR